MILAVLCALGALLLGSAVPGPWRSPARVGLGFFVVLSPLIAAAALLSALPTKPSTWLLFLPLTLVWLVLVDLRFGLSARIARRPGSLGRRGRLRGP